MHHIDLEKFDEIKAHVANCYLTASGQIYPHLSDVRWLIDSHDALTAQVAELRAALTDCDQAFAAWQVGQTPGRPDYILALIIKVRAALAKGGVNDG